MRRHWLALALVFWMHAVGTEAAPAPLTPDCRYLFVVDTSLSMARLQNQVSSSLSQMISSGLGGQMAPGEVFTIWTFNEAVQQREYPLNSWSPDLKQQMGNRVVQFMQNQRYRRSPNMRALINAVYQAKQTCPKLAVFLISNGQEVLVGTPFDRNINVSYGRRFEELRSAKVPFVTALLCQNGEFVGWSVGAANERVTLPLGKDGKQVVGRDLAPATPVMNTPAPVAVAPLVPKPVTTNLPTAKPIATVLTNRTGRPASMRPPIITIQGGPEPERKVIDLKSTKKGEDAPRVVKPTEIAPKPKIQLTRTTFRKTNDVAAVSKPVPTNGAPVRKPSVTMQAAKLNPPKTNQVAVAMPAPQKTLTVKETPKPKPPPAKAIIPTPKAAAPKALPAVTNTASVVRTAPPAPEPKVIIQVVTQVVHVPVPAIRNTTPPKQQVPEVVVPSESAKPEGKETPVRNVEPKPAAVVTTAPPAQAPEPSVPAGSTNAPAAARPAPPEAPQSGPGLGLVTAPNMMSWVYLGIGIVVILIAIACTRKLTSRPIESSMISQSMERRDNR